MNFDTKGAIASRSLWGAGIAVFAQLLSAGLHLDPNQSAEVLNLSTQTIDVGIQAITIGGAAWAFYGRLMAKKPIITTTTPQEK